MVFLGRQIENRPEYTFPALSLLSAFGQTVPLNLEFQRRRRIIPCPFHLLDNNKAMNVLPKNYSWPEFYQHVVALSLRILLAANLAPAASLQSDAQVGKRAASRILLRIRAYQVPFDDSSVARH